MTAQIDLWTQFMGYATENEMFAGLVGASLVGSLIFALRSVPQTLLFMIRRQFTVELQVYNTDETFQWLSLWLAHQPYARRARRLTLSSTNRDNDLNWTLLPGEGFHWFWYQYRLVTIQHEIDTDQSRGAFLREKLLLRTFGRRQEFMREIIREAEALRVTRAGVVVKVFTGGWWQQIGYKDPRPLESVIMPSGQIERIIVDADRFFSAAAWYRDHGVPYRRGYLFSGSTGTGKTSLVLAMATVFKRPLYVLNLGSVDDDDKLLSAFLDVPAEAILLIEDVDVTSASKQRRKKSGGGEGNKKDQQRADNKEEGSGVTLSALLNVVDGVVAPDGRLLVMTTNYPDKLDPALIRPGRVDLHEHFAPLDRETGQRLCQRFHISDDELARIMDIYPWPRSGAEIQQALIAQTRGK